MVCFYFMFQIKIDMFKTVQLISKILKKWPHFFLFLNYFFCRKQ